MSTHHGLIQGVRDTGCWGASTRATRPHHAGGSHTLLAWAFVLASLALAGCRAPGAPSSDLDASRTQALASLPPDTPILWFIETSGYVPVELAEQFQSQPQRLLLTADGTLTVRNDRFERHTVQLAPADRDALLAQARATGVLNTNPSRLPTENDAVVLDAGGQRLGYDDGMQRAVIEISATTEHWVRTYPHNSGLRRWHAFATLLRHTSQSRTEPLVQNAEH